MISEFCPENSDPGSFLQQRVSSHVRSSFHLFATLENFTLRHFDLNLPANGFPAQCAKRFESFWVGCSEYRPATGCTRARRCRRACRRTCDQVQRRLRLCHIISSLVPCRILFDITSGQVAELKILILNRWRRLSHSSRVELPFVNMSTSWC